MMKRILCIASCAMVLFAFACAPATTGVVTSAAPEPTAAATTATPEPTPEPAPEPLGLAPIDLLGKGYNPFYDVAFPAGYTVYGARFDSGVPGKGTKDFYAIFLTAEGNPADIAKTCAGMLGVTDEAQLAAYVESLDKDGFLQIEGTFAGGFANAGMKKTSAGGDFDQCTEVDGCRVEIGVDANPDLAEQYRALALANYSTAMLGDLAAQLGDETISQDQVSILVNTQRPDKTTVYLTHTVKDAAALLSSITGTLKTSWYDEANASFAIDYAMQRVKYSFDTANNVVRVEFSPNDNSMPAKSFQKSAVSFTSLGFASFPNDGLCIYKEDQNHLEIAIAKPGWGHNEDWNFEFLGESNGCSLGMWYTEATGLFHVSVNKGDDGAAAEFNVAKNAFESDVYPDEETQTRLFREAAGISEGDHRAAVFALFEQAISDRFDMTWQELYALPVW